MYVPVHGSGTHGCPSGVGECRPFQGSRRFTGEQAGMNCVDLSSTFVCVHTCVYTYVMLLKVHIILYLMPTFYSFYSFYCVLP